MVLIITIFFYSKHSMSSGTMPPSTAVAEYNIYYGLWRTKCIRAPTIYLFEIVIAFTIIANSQQLVNLHRNNWISVKPINYGIVGIVKDISTIYIMTWIFFRCDPVRLLQWTTNLVAVISETVFSLKIFSTPDGGPAEHVQHCSH